MADCGADSKNSITGKACGCSSGLDARETLEKSGSAFEQGVGRKAAWADALIELPGGSFLMGCADDDGWPADGEGPVREVTVSQFSITATTITNAQFAEFVEDTGYVTESERHGWSHVFLGQLAKGRQKKLKQKSSVKNLQWWYAVDGACWKHPIGPGSSIKDLMDHPVIAVSWDDAMAFCKWAGEGTRLPTEAEWEYAARGGTVQQRFPWGDSLVPGGKFMCNTFQGTFPEQNTVKDGYAATAPVKSFQPNAFGMYNVIGNVWEWCADWFDPEWHTTDDYTAQNPKGPEVSPSRRRAMRGGSFLCHSSYCNRYRLGARTGNTPDSATTNLGFRIVVGKG